MRILFAGGWKTGRDSEANKELVTSYCESLAEHIVKNNHQVVLTSYRNFDKIIADKVALIAEEQKKDIKKHLFFLLSDRVKDIPTQGKVKRIELKRWRIEERTFCVQQSDALIVIGGGKGTLDSVEKAFLAEKPVFIAAAIPCPATEAWNRRKQYHKYITDGDADFADDLNITPNDFFNEVFRIMNEISEIKYPRRIFIVHGRDHYFKDTLVHLLKTLEFEVVVLQDEPSKSLTIIEKLERDTEKIGFSFVLYTPDDLGHLPNNIEKPRARQNVIFEHGLLIGLLGRERTCAIIKGNLEIPSDINGMIYESLEDIKRDAIKIAKILKEAGYIIDFSKLA